MTYMLCAGEASGDLHASELIRAMREQDPDADFVFLGGDLMAQASGRRPAVHYRDMAFMGFSDVVRHLPKVRENLSIAKKLLTRVVPDALILIDYPSFNLRLAAMARKLDIPVYYYISPKVWAWKEFRTAKIAEYCRRVLAIFPFEPAFYASHGYSRCTYVGNPSVEEIDRRLAEAPDPEAFRAAHNLDSRPVIAIVPGSRISEIQRNLPLMLEAARVLQSKYNPVVAGAPGVDPSVYPDTIPVVFDATTQLMHVAAAALVTSGTASLEAALARVPQVVCYRHTGSRVTYAVMSRVLKIPYVSLPNLIARQEVVPELLLHKCTPLQILKRLLAILPGHPAREDQLRGYDLIRTRLGHTHAAATAAGLILSDLRPPL